MFPLTDSTPRRTFPFVNYAIILVNVLVFLVELSVPDIEKFTLSYSFIPQNFHIADPASYFYIITSIFLHGGFLHIISNMWFLHIFGDNVEDRFGHVLYLIFYLLAGVAATLGQYILSPHSSIPMLGASGAISGVAGAYFVMFRKSTVKTLIPVFGFPAIIDLSVPFFLGYWFLIQVFSGVGSLVTFDLQQGGVAWFAHIAGFIFGYLCARLVSSFSAQVET